MSRLTQELHHASDSDAHRARASHRDGDGHCSGSGSHVPVAVVGGGRRRFPGRPAAALEFQSSTTVNNRLTLSLRGRVSSTVTVSHRDNDSDARSKFGITRSAARVLLVCATWTAGGNLPGT